MTSTGTFEGLAAGRNSSKVLKPPGGGSSDIFGASESTSPRRVKQNQSTLSSAFFGSSNGSSVTDSSSNTAASTPSSNGSAPETPRSKPGGAMNLSRNPVTGAGVDFKPQASRRIVRRSRDGNPVTGAGYELHQNGTSNGGMSSAASSSAGSEKSSTDSSPSIGREPVQRLKNRVPPGGFSSGLW